MYAWFPIVEVEFFFIILTRRIVRFKPNLIFWIVSSISSSIQRLIVERDRILGLAKIKSWIYSKLKSRLNKIHGLD